MRMPTIESIKPGPNPNPVITTDPLISEKQVVADKLPITKPISWTSVPVMHADPHVRKNLNDDLPKDLALQPPLQNTVNLPNFKQKNNGSLEVTPIDLVVNLLDKNRIVAIGETHAENNATLFLSNPENIAKFKSAGVTTLFLEVIDVSNLEQANTLKRYMSGNATDAQLRAVLDGKGKEGGSNEFGYRPDDYIRLIRTARDNGLKVVGIDTRSEHEKRNINGNEASLPYRDRDWAANVTKAMANKPNEKALILGGYGHFNNSQLGFLDNKENNFGRDAANTRLGVPTMRFSSSTLNYKFDTNSVIRTSAIGMVGSDFIVKSDGPRPF